MSRSFFVFTNKKRKDLKTMSENTNPLTDFLEGGDNGNSLFDNLPFPTEEEKVTTAEEPKTEEVKPEVTEQTEEPKEAKQTAFAEALSQTPAAPANTDDDPFAAAMKKATEQSEKRLVDGIAQKEAIFNYGKAKDAITDHDCTFEDLRQKYETDFPELSESKKVSWTVTYGKVTKNISNPGSDKVYDIKAEIEKSKAFLDGIKKAKTDADKNPECIVKPRIIAQSKGEMDIPSYKGYSISLEEARKSNKTIVLLPSKDGRIFQMRKTEVGNFIAPAKEMPEFEAVVPKFEMALPKIPMHILMFILNFFKEMSDRFQYEALVHILYDTKHHKYTMRVPKQELSHVSVDCVLEEEYPDYLIHVMDIHSHNVMPARFSATDDNDEKSTRLYAVVGRLNRVFPEISVRAGCAGEFIPIAAEDVFDMSFKEYPYPNLWNKQLIMPPKEVKFLPELCKSVSGETK